MYCEKCGEEINDNALFCPYCGYKVGVQPAHGGNILYDFDPSHRYDNSYQEDRYREYDPGYVPHYRYKSTAAVLALLFGWLGFHNFYLGYTKKGLYSLFSTFLGWALSPPFGRCLNLSILSAAKSPMTATVTRYNPAKDKRYN